MIDREDLYRAATTALATISASETPEWLREMAWRTYEDMCWHLDYDPSACGDEAHYREAWLMAYGGAYEKETNDFIAQLPDEIKAKYPADVMVAIHAAKAVDNLECTIDSRMESLAALDRTLTRLRDDAGTESFDSVDPDKGYSTNEFIDGRFCDHGIDYDRF